MEDLSQMQQDLHMMDENDLLMKVNLGAEILKIEEFGLLLPYMYINFDVHRMTTWTAMGTQRLQEK